MDVDTSVLIYPHWSSFRKGISARTHTQSFVSDEHTDTTKELKRGNASEVDRRLSLRVSGFWFRVSGFGVGFLAVGVMREDLGWGIEGLEFGSSGLGFRVGGIRA